MAKSDDFPKRRPPGPAPGIGLSAEIAHGSIAPVSSYTELTALLAEAGITDVDPDEAVADEHVRASAYRRMVAVAAASRNHAGDRALVATILNDPEELTAKTALVDFVDNIAMRAADPAAFREWAAELRPDLHRLKAVGHREFIRRRLLDWLFWLSIEHGRVPVPAEFAEVTDWMQRKIAEESTSIPVLTLLTESGSTKKIRNAAKTRAKVVGLESGHR